jgi:hypothetical protein
MPALRWTIYGQHPTIKETARQATVGALVSGWGAVEKRDRNAHLSESVNTLACITSRHGEVDRNEGHVGNGGFGGWDKRPLGREQRGTPAQHVHAVTRVSDALQLPSQNCIING